MARRRVLYALALMGGALFFPCFEAYTSLFVLALLLGLPLLSLLLTLPVLRGAELTLSPQPGRLPRGEEGVLVLTLRLPLELPVVRLSGRLRVGNALTGERELHRLRLRSPGGVLEETFPLPTGHCGALECALERPRLTDWLGLFSLPLPGGTRTARAWVLPAPMAPGPLPPVLAGLGREGGWKPRPGGGPGEDYDLREYRPGDLLRSVHWKLSSKRDELVVRETLEPRRSVLLLTADHFGPAEEVDAVLDRLQTLSRLLLEKEAPHVVAWAHPASGEVSTFRVDGEGSLRACLEAFLLQQAPREGRSILDGPLSAPGGPPRHFHITPNLWPQGGDRP